VVARKEFQNRRPVTWYGLTAKGKRALSQHLASLEQLIQQARGVRE
jgi:DNA-binding PadR family transcriptional regulator